MPEEGEFYILTRRYLLLVRRFGVRRGRGVGVTDQGDLAGLEQQIGYRMADLSLLRAALTHKSYSNEHPGVDAPHNERLEFLGDAVLDLCISDLLFQRYPQLSEGDLTRIRAELVNERSLAPVGEGLGLGGYLLLGRGEESSGGRQKPSLLADALEAVLGAVYRDGGMSAVSAVIEALLARQIEQAVQDRQGTDYKTRLQERLQASGCQLPSYQLLEAQGPDHQKSYVVEVHCGQQAIGTGRGRTKKAAQQQAAYQALLRLDS